MWEKVATYNPVSGKEPVAWGQTQSLILGHPPALAGSSSQISLRFSLLICMMGWVVPTPQGRVEEMTQLEKALGTQQCSPKCDNHSMAICTGKFVGQLEEHMIWRLMLRVELWTVYPPVIYVNWARSMNSWGWDSSLWNGCNTVSTVHRIPWATNERDIAETEEVIISPACHRLLGLRSSLGWEGTGKQAPPSSPDFHCPHRHQVPSAWALSQGAK